MRTEYLTISNEFEMELIERAAAVLREGGLVALPTETVYGLGANALDPAAARKIFVAKGRPADNPLIIHIAEFSDIFSYVEEVPPRAEAAMRALCPAPLTGIFKKKACIPNEVSAGLDTVAVRIPDQAVTRAIIRAAGVPIAAPSANTSGKPSPTTAEHVRADMDGKIEMIVDGGVCSVGIESTVVDFTGSVPIILRPGKIGSAELKPFFDDVAVDRRATDLTPSEEPVRSPGMKYKHYAPDAEVYVVEGSRMATCAKIQELVQKYSQKRIGVLAQQGSESEFRDCADVVLSGGSTPEEYAAHLFYSLRKFDEEKVDIVFAQYIPEGEMALAIRNRLYRSAANRIIRV
jgi:L-threonylcarbamoyladenylate synthase